MSRLTDLTDECRFGFDYANHLFADQKLANRAWSWVKEFGLIAKLERVAVEGIAHFYIVFENGPNASEIFKPPGPTFAEWRDYTRQWAEQIAFENWKRQQKTA